MVGLLPRAIESMVSRSVLHDRPVDELAGHRDLGGYLGHGERAMPERPDGLAELGRSIP